MGAWSPDILVSGYIGPRDVELRDLGHARCAWNPTAQCDVRRSHREGDLFRTTKREQACGVARACPCGVYIVTPHHTGCYNKQTSGVGRTGLPRRAGVLAPGLVPIRIQRCVCSTLKDMSRCCDKCHAYTGATDRIAPCVQTPHVSCEFDWPLKLEIRGIHRLSSQEYTGSGLGADPEFRVPS